MKRYRPALLVFLFALAASCAWVATRPHHVVAASVSNSKMTMPQAAPNKPTPGLIDGGLHPELIPDSVAYRLFFLAASDGDPSPTPQQVAHQAVMLLNAGVQAKPAMVKTLGVLTSFREQYTTLVTNYNTSWYVTHNSTAGLPRFLAQRDALVQLTRDQLKSVLSSKTMAAFDSRVQAEKVHMKTTEGGVQ